MTTSPNGPSHDQASSDPSPVPAALLRSALLTRLQTDGWSVSDAADTGLAMSVMLNTVMVGASVNMTALFESGSTAGTVEVSAFSLTNEMSEVGPAGTIVRAGTPEVAIAQHPVLEQPTCTAHVAVSEDLDTSVDAIIAAVAACVEQYRLLAV